MDDTPGMWITAIVRPHGRECSPPRAAMAHSGVHLVSRPGNIGRKGNIMGRTMGAVGMRTPMRQRAAELRERAMRRICVLDARMRTLTEEPEEGAATAEYAVVLVAATGFAALLVTLLKSGTVKNLLTDIVKQALSVA